MGGRRAFWSFGGRALRSNGRPKARVTSLGRLLPDERLPTTLGHIADHAGGRQSTPRGRTSRSRARRSLKALTNMARMGRPAAREVDRAGRTEFEGRFSEAGQGLRAVRPLRRHSPVAFFCKTALTAPKRR